MPRLKCAKNLIKNKQNPFNFLGTQVEFLVYVYETRKIKKKQKKFVCLIKKENKSLILQSTYSCYTSNCVYLTQLCYAIILIKNS